MLNAEFIDASSLAEVPVWRRVIAGNVEWGLLLGVCSILSRSCTLRLEDMIPCVEKLPCSLLSSSLASGSTVGNGGAERERASEPGKEREREN